MFHKDFVADMWSPWMVKKTKNKALFIPLTRCLLKTICSTVFPSLMKQHYFWYNLFFGSLQHYYCTSLILGENVRLVVLLKTHYRPSWSYSNFIFCDSKSHITKSSITKLQWALQSQQHFALCSETLDSTQRELAKNLLLRKYIYIWHRREIYGLNTCNETLLIYSGFCLALLPMYETVSV